MYKRMPQTTCEILFNRFNPIYFNGEEICGNAVLTTNKNLKIEEMIIHCKGYAEVNWFEYPRFHSSRLILEHNDSSAKDLKAEILHHHGHEIYLDECMKLSEAAIIVAGQHIYPFTFHLPRQCPPTCDKKYGKVCYMVTLVLRRLSKFDKKFVQYFVVRNHLNLNDGEAEGEEYTTRCYSFDVPLRDVPHCWVHFSTPYSGYVPGQNIPCLLKLTSYRGEWSKNLKLKVRLYQQYTFRAKVPNGRTAKKIEVRKLATMHDDDQSDNGVGVTSAPGVKELKCYLRLPLLSPISSALANTLITVDYYLEGIVSDAHLGKGLAKLFIPITIGSKALQGAQKENDEVRAFCYDNPTVRKSFVDPVTISLAEKSLATTTNVMDERGLLLSDEELPRKSNRNFVPHFRKTLYKQFSILF